jgi:hypothetical protein
MCKETDRPNRRHRAMYIAPSARPLHPQLIVPDFGDPVLPLLEASPGPQHHQEDLESPPPTAPLSGSHDSPPAPQSRWRILRWIFLVYHWFVDVLLLLVVCFMGCFFYDVEVKVVKSDRRQTTARGTSGRVGLVIRTEEQRAPRTPPRSAPRSAPLSWGVVPSPRGRDNMWDAV